MRKVAFLIGSKSDFEVIKPGVKLLKNFGIEVDVKILSAHRTPDEAINFAKNAKQNGYDVIIAAAGKAAHLPGVIASNTTLPVIGVPVKSSTLDGLDALLSIVQMPKGIPVATVAIDGVENAALLATRIMALYDREIQGKLEEYISKMKEEVLQQNRELSEELKRIQL